MPASVVKKEDTVTADDAAVEPREPVATLRTATAEEEDEAEVSWNPQQVAVDGKSDMTSPAGTRLAPC